jgi:hypothetical protein
MTYHTLFDPEEDAVEELDFFDSPIGFYDMPFSEDDFSGFGSNKIVDIETILET